MTLNVIQPCGTARLLTKVMGGDLSTAWVACGLLLCPVCQTPGENQDLYPYCSKKCRAVERKADNQIPLICDVCDKHFLRKKSEVMAWARRGGQSIYCGKRCLGIDTAKKYGLQKGHKINLGRTYSLKRINSHCKRGHPFDEANTYISPSGGQRCRTCKRVSSLARYHRTKVLRRSSGTQA